MRHLAWFCLMLLGRFCFASNCDDVSLHGLYDSGRLFELRDAVKKDNAPLLYQGIVACSFNELHQCKKKLETVIRSAPMSNDARDARAALIAVYFRSGRYREALSKLDAILAVSPEDPARNERPLVAALARLPSQSVTRRKPSKVVLHAWGNDLAIPLTINGQRATYAFDTGNFAVAVSLSEARRLGLSIYPPVAGATVNGIPIQVALAHKVAVGNFRFKNVAFFVVPDDQQPFTDMPQQERGVIGLPTLLAFRNFSWGSDGLFEFGLQVSERMSEPNVSFDEQHLFVQVEFSNSKLALGLDTGAETTTLGPRFSQTFPEIVGESGKKGTKRIEEVGSSREIDSIILPQVQLQIGGFPITLRPAHILLDGPAKGCDYGNLGMDLMKKSRRTTIDFQSMTLTMR